MTASVFGVAVDLRHFHMLCLLTFEVFVRRDIMSAFLILHLLSQLSDTEEVVHSLERKSFGLGDAIKRTYVSVLARLKDVSAG